MPNLQKKITIIIQIEIYKTWRIDAILFQFGKYS